MTWKLVVLGLWFLMLIATMPVLYSSTMARTMWLPDALVAATLLAGIATIWAAIL